MNTAIQNRLFRGRTDHGALIAFGASILIIIAATLLIPNFGSARQYEAMLVTMLFFLIATFGQHLVILSGSGGIDLSVGMTVSVGGMAIASFTHGLNAPLIWAIPATLLITSGIGLFNAIGIVHLRIPPFIMTLATSTISFGVALGLTLGRSQPPVAPALENFVSGSVFGVKIPLILLVLFIIFGVLFEHYTSFGRRLYAVGNSARAATLAGLNTKQVLYSVYTISGLCAGLTGILLAGYSSSATLTMGEPYLLATIAAVVVGGCRIEGGRGTFFGALAGVFFLSIVATLISVLGLSAGLRTIIEGGVILGALILQTIRSANNTDS